MHVPAEEIAESLIAGRLPDAASSSTRSTSQDDVRGVVDTIAIWGVPYGAPLRKAMPRVRGDRTTSRRSSSRWTGSTPSGRRSACASTRRELPARREGPRHADRHDEPGDGVPPAQGGHRGRGQGRALPAGRPSSRERAVPSADGAVRRRRGARPARSARRTASRSTRPRCSYLESELDRRVRACARGLRHAQGARARGTATRSASASSISYLWAKQNEVTNLRIIVKGKSVGMPADRVRRGAHPCISSSSSPTRTPPTASAWPASTSRSSTRPRRRASSSTALRRRRRQRHHRGQRATDGRRSTSACRRRSTRSTGRSWSRCRSGRSSRWARTTAPTCRGSSGERSDSTSH